MTVDDFVSPVTHITSSGLMKALQLPGQYQIDFSTSCEQCMWSFDNKTGSYYQVLMGSQE